VAEVGEGADELGGDEAVAGVAKEDGAGVDLVELLRRLFSSSTRALGRGGGIGFSRELCRTCGMQRRSSCLQFESSLLI
jgi:hypothetical protein